MPYTRVPIINRFGIISTSYHEELLKHSAKNITKNTIEKPKKALLITKEFIKKFNDSENLEDERLLQDQARKMLFRCKRRLGLSSLGVGKHVDIPAAWIEAIYLAQCKGEIQEEALNMLCASLDHASLHCSHLSTLFFIAESVLYRICCDASQKSYLYSSEIKLIKIGFLTFLRLFVYHLYGNLEGFETHLLRLQPYLFALYFCEDTYSKYPNILSIISFMKMTGEVICFPGISETHEDTDTKQDVIFPGMKVNSKPYSKRQEVSHLLWHCIVVWSCVQNQTTQLNEVLEHLLKHKKQLQKKFCLESILCFFILGDAAKLNMSCLKIFMNLGKDFILSCISPQKQEENKDDDPSWEWIIAYMYITVLGDICLHATTSILRKIAYTGFYEHENTSKYLERKNIKSMEPMELKEANFLDLLTYFSSQISDNCCQLIWTVYYGLIYNLVKMIRELYGDEKQDGLRNLLWKILQRIKCDEKDVRILTALDVAEAELNSTINPFIGSTVKAPGNNIFFQYIGHKVAYVLSKLFLSPLGPSSLLLKRSEKEQKMMKYKLPKDFQMEKKVIRIFSRERYPQKELVRPYPDIIARADMALKTLIDKQWEKEQLIRLKEEKKLLTQKKKQKRKEELEHYQAMMKRREEKIHKTTKPYELPGLEYSEPMTSDRSSNDPNKQGTCIA
ncbi:transmembrane protein 232 [Sarcophilus harrisii]